MTIAVGVGAGDDIVEGPFEPCRPQGSGEPSQISRRQEVVNNMYTQYCRRAFENLRQREIVIIVPERVRELRGNGVGTEEGDQHLTTQFTHASWEKGGRGHHEGEKHVLVRRARIGAKHHRDDDEEEEEQDSAHLDHVGSVGCRMSGVGCRVSGVGWWFRLDHREGELCVGDVERLSGSSAVRVLESSGYTEGRRVVRVNEGQGQGPCGSASRRRRQLGGCR